jgi:hypothetical protein
MEKISDAFDVWGPGCDPKDYDDISENSGIIMRDGERRPTIDEYAENGVSRYDFV